MKVKQFLYWKNRGSYADALGAAGLAELIYQLTLKPIMIEDQGSSFLLSLTENVDLDQLPYENLIKDPGFRPYTNKMYDRDKQKADQYREKRKNIKNLTDEEKQQIETQKPDPEWPLFQNLKILQALSTYNSMYEQIKKADKEKFTLMVRKKLEGFSMGKQSEEVPTRLSLKASPVQAFNPSIGKGINRPKPDGVPISSFPTSLMDGFEEYLRYLGVKSILHAYSMDKDIKFVAIIPGKIAYEELRSEIIRGLRQKHLAWTSVKVDITAVLILVNILLDHYQLVKDHKVNEILHGIQVAHFKDMGQVKSLINQSFIRLPGWFPIQTQEDIQEMKGIIEEHLACIRQLDEKKSEDIHLLQIYRDGLSTDNFDQIVRFFAGYGMYVMKKLSDKKGYPPFRFTEENLRRLLMKSNLTYAQIVENKGFQNIAKAIRNATVNEQVAKKYRPQQYEIRYDLFQNLKQQASFPEKFLAKLMEFINDYNKEAARKLEQQATNLKPNQRLRARVSTEDIEEFVKLFDQYRQQSETIAMLLIAYASAKTSQQEEDIPEENNENQETIVIPE
ncbi:hypothetical protein [Tepidibacillus fermentans]|uniref:Uncharacterized protein n=1 Tax=Tepidibacillus fermentans TaxID=1281767 RepID=A0A4R3K7J7_9BACI|nr:hypothetical protein [Tepidibacillus fermentans]TCS78924.1 hypothetical protein EDD72_1243 [Tepidibacillus fermentans]